MGDSNKYHGLFSQGRKVFSSFNYDYFTPKRMRNINYLYFLQQAIWISYFSQSFLGGLSDELTEA